MAAIRDEWWKAFGDPALDAMVARAIAGNSDLAIAAGRVAEARAQYGIVRSQQLPSLGAGAGGQRERFVNPFGQPAEQTAGQAQLQAAYEVDLFGRLASGTAAARAALLASEAARETVRLAIISSAVSGYIQLRALDARLEVLRQTLAARTDSLRIARRRAEAGYATNLELRQSEAEARATEQLIPTTELAIRRQEDALSLLLGESPRAIERGAPLDRLAPPPPPESLPAALLRQRPDIAQAEQQMIAVDHSLDAARAAFMPQVQLSASGGYVASTLLTDPIGIFSLGGSVLAPLFAGGRLRAQADAAAARRDQAAFGYQRAALAAFRDVEDALAAVRRTAEQEQVVVAQRDALSGALRLATNRYRAGYSPYLDQLDAQRGLLGAELALVQAHADRLSAYVSLCQSLGGGWSAERLASR